MGCVIKLKERENYRIFDNENDASDYIKKNNIVVDTDKEGNKYLRADTTHLSVCSILGDSHARASEKIGEVLAEAKINDWNIEEYTNASDAISLSTYLGDMVVEENGTAHRLFPEFISNNYLNVIIQNEICKHYLQNTDKWSDVKSEQEIAINTLRRKIFEDLPTDKRDAKLLTAAEWLTYFNKERKSDYNITHEELIAIDTYAQSVNEDNFEAMLRGEIIHTIFEQIIRNNSISNEQIINKVKKLFAEDGLFKTRYGDKYEEVPNSLAIIERIQKGHDKIKKLDDLLKGYIDFCRETKKNIEADLGKGAKDITWFSETRVTGDLDGDAEKHFGKNKIRGKIDAILVVDGVPHIIDFKVSKNNFDNWPSEKKLKTKYQLATYERLLSRMGLNTSNSSTSVVAIQTRETGELSRNSKRIPLTSDIKFSSIPSNLDIYMRGVKEERIIDVEMGDRINGYVEAIFGQTSAKALKTSSIDDLVNSLKKRVKEEKGGTFTINYTLLNTKSLQFEAKEKTGITKENLEKELNDIATEIHNANSLRYKATFDALKADLKEFFTSEDMDITNFKVIDSHNTDMVNQFLALFSKYKNSNAKIVFEEIGDKFGMIIIETPTGIDVINYLSFSPKTSWSIDNKNARLFDNVPGMRQSKLLQTMHNVRSAQAFIVLNELLHGTSKKIGQITSIQMGRASADYMTVKNMKNVVDEVFDALALSGVNVNKNISSDNIIDPFVGVFSAFSSFISQISKLKHGGSVYLMGDPDIEGSKKSILKEIFEDPKNLDVLKMRSSDFTTKDKVVILQSMIQKIEREFPQYFNANGTAKVVNEVTTLKDYMVKAISYYNRIEFVVESDLSEWGLSRGVQLASMDLIPEENIEIVRNVVSTGFEQVSTRFQKYLALCRTQVKNLKEGNGYSGTRQNMIGDVVSNYSNLFRRKQGTNELLDGDLQFKNPWTDTTLKPHEIEFIKFVLYSLNKHAYGRKYKWTSYKDIQENQFNDEDYYCPLMRATGFDRFRSETDGVKMDLFKKEWWKENFKRARNNLTETDDLLSGQYSNNRQLSCTLNSLYNQHATRTNKQVRKDLIERNGGIENFSRDVETLLYAFMLSQDMKEIFDINVLPQIRTILYAAMFQEHVTGEQMPVFKEFVETYMQSAVYGSPIAGRNNPEIREAFKVIGPLRSVGATLALSYNVMNLPRELIMGFFTNISRAMFNSYGGETFNVKEYTHALGILSGDIPGFIRNVTKVELLNEHYRFSNMSISEIPEQVTSNKTGIFALGSRFMTWSLTAPDYFNRMSILISQMIHDGCWEAYELKETDGVVELVYDMTKDKRFSLFAEYASQYGEEAVNHVPKSDLAEFNKQAALYTAMREEFAQTQEDGSMYDNDQAYYVPFTKAYTNRQRDSLKSFADLSFGYYDRETKAKFFKTAVGLIMKQFMAFLSSKKMQYFQVRSNNTARGSFKQLTDAKGLTMWSVKVDGQIKLVNEEQLESEYAEYKEYAQPKLVWQGTYMEGIFQSYVHLGKSLCIGTANYFKNGDSEIFKQLYKEYFKSGDIRHSNLLQGIWDLFISLLFIRLLYMAMLEDPEKSGVSYATQIKRTDPGTRIFLITMTNATADFNVLTSMSNLFLEWDIPSFNIVQNGFRQFMGAFGDEDLTFMEELAKGTTRSIGAFKVWRPFIDPILEN